jgi:hypothetical protein
MRPVNIHLIILIERLFIRGEKPAAIVEISHGANKMPAREKQIQTIIPAVKILPAIFQAFSGDSEIKALVKIGIKERLKATRSISKKSIGIILAAR